MSQKRRSDVIPLRDEAGSVYLYPVSAGMSGSVYYKDTE